MLILAVTLLLLAMASPVSAIEGLPGKTWGELRYDMPRHMDTNTLLEGWVEQGIHWTSWKDLKLNTYVAGRYKLDSEDNDWNNSVGPAVGVALERFFPQGLAVRGGLEYYEEHFHNSGRVERKGVLYINWYGWWDLMKR
jgi:hypothetical protein